MFRTLVIILMGSCAVAAYAGESSQSRPGDEAGAFELCDTCSVAKDFEKFAKYKASEVAGRHALFVGNANTGMVYKIVYTVNGGASTDCTCDPTIDSVERQNEATEKDFMNLVRAIRD